MPIKKIYSNNRDAFCFDYRLILIQLDLMQVLAASEDMCGGFLSYLKQLVITLVTHNPDHAKLDSKLLRF